MKEKLNRERLLVDRLSEYLDEVAEGKRTTPEEFAARYPDLAAEIILLMADIDHIKQALQLPDLDPGKSEALLRRIRNALLHGDPTALPVNQRPDFLILLLYYTGQVWGKTKLAKLLFLLWKEGGCDKYVEDYYRPYAYNFGAFDKQMPMDVEALVERNVIHELRPTVPKPGAAEELSAHSKKRVDAIYELTPVGKKIAMKLVKGASAVDPAILQKVQQIVSKYGDLNGEQLIDYTYNKYPEFAEKSLVRDQYLRNPGEGSSGTDQP